MHSRVFFMLTALLLPLGSLSQFGFDSNTFSTAVGALAVLKGAALLFNNALNQSGGFRGGGNRFRGRPNRRRNRHRFHGKRSVETLFALDSVTASEDFLLATVEELDWQGCVLKLICSVQAKREAERTFEETVLAAMFNGTERVTPYNVDFVVASGKGDDAAAEPDCASAFPYCDLEEPQLAELLQDVWGCTFAVPRDNQVQTDGDVKQDKKLP